MTYQIRLAPSALQLLREIADRRIQVKLQRAIDGLVEEPAKQGKPLLGDLGAYRSLRAVGERYRIVCRVDDHSATVLILALGIRKTGSKKDVYALARKLLRLRLVGPPRKK